MTHSPTTTPFPLEVRKDTRFDFRSVQAVHASRNTYVDHVANALSLVAPVTEGFLVRVVRRGLNAADPDPRLKADLEAFLGQEGLHTREHRRLNAQLRELGFAASDGVKRFDSRLRALEESSELRDQIAAVVAGEHVIYAVSKVALDKQGMLSGLDPEVRRLLTWHAVEEMEHQSVCHDLYLHLFGDHPGRRRVYLRAYEQATRVVLRSLAEIFAELVRVSPRTSPGEALAFARWLFVRPAVLPAIASQLFVFVAPRFAPWEDADTDRRLIAEGLAAAYASRR